MIKTPFLRPEYLNSPYFPLLNPRTVTSTLTSALLTSALLTSALTGAVIWANPSAAVELGDGSTHFVDLPRLEDTGSSQTDIRAHAAKHYITLTVPPGATEDLGQVQVQQREGSDRRWSYRLDAIHAFEGTPSQRGDRLPLLPPVFDRPTHTLTLTFDPPVSPGTTLTLALTPWRNPAYDGVYLWGVTVWPAGDNAAGQFLGYGRFHFYRPDSRVWFR